MWCLLSQREWDREVCVVAFISTGLICRSLVDTSQLVTMVSLTQGPFIYILMAMWLNKLKTSLFSKLQEKIFWIFQSYHMVFINTRPDVTERILKCNFFTVNLRILTSRCIQLQIKILWHDWKLLQPLVE